MNPYQKFVHNLAASMDDGKSWPLGGFEPAPRPEIPDNAPTALIFSPHPDDECIIGALPLRLLRQARMNVINVAVTHGSTKERRQPRLEELRGACDYLGFGLIQTRKNGLQKINAKTRDDDPVLWADAVDCVAGILRAEKPQLVLIPHESDWNTSHIGTHLLLVDTMKSLGNEAEWNVVETEYWAPMPFPNLVVESTEQDVTDLVTALSFHAGEVRRNPYHLSLASWMIDNVRRGGELVGSQGAAVPDFRFATLYRLRRWRRGTWADRLDAGRFIGASDAVSKVFK